MESLNILSKPSYTYTGNVIGINKDYNMQDNQNQTHWIYAAAIMDSDGCFMINRHLDKGSYSYLPTVKISMINTGSIDYILESTGLGYTFINGTRPSRPNSMPMHDWRITKSDDLRKFLNGILPYLRNKKNRAEFLIEFLDKGNYGHHGRKSGIRLTKEELDYREQAYFRMRELNSNKVGATTKS
jgi:hypothetical protein